MKNILYFFGFVVSLDLHFWFIIILLGHLSSSFSSGWEADEILELCAFNFAEFQSTENVFFPERIFRKWKSQQTQTRCQIFTGEPKTKIFIRQIIYNFQLNWLVYFTREKFWHSFSWCVWCKVHRETLLGKRKVVISLGFVNTTNGKYLRNIFGQKLIKKIIKKSFASVTLPSDVNKSSVSVSNYDMDLVPREIFGRDDMAFVFRPTFKCGCGKTGKGLPWSAKHFIFRKLQFKREPSICGIG